MSLLATVARFGILAITMNAHAIVAGHICLDIIPTLEARHSSLDQFLKPGQLVKIGPAIVAPGGSVFNTGLALHRLGVPTRLLGKVGDDALGRAVLDVLRTVDPALATGMVIAPGEATSYTVVISPPGIDRMFLHCPGVNDTFSAADVSDHQLAGACLFHFGYPPMMRRMYLDDGRELESLFRRIKAAGLTTTLDMVMIDPASEAGQMDWTAIFRRVLPLVDIFLPSFDEILLLLHRPSTTSLSEMGTQLLDWGAGVVGLKLGNQGLYYRTRDRELLTPCFQVKVAGTTGSGDATIAGFLAGWLHGLSVEAMLTAAVAVGACCCEQPDATSGIPSWDTVQRRIAAGWAQLPVTLSLPGWHYDNALRLWRGPNDR